jgi:opacity protein-like surface antigen
MKRAIIIFSILLLILGGVLAAEKVMILKVKAQVANVRALPDASAEVITRVTAGTLLESTKKSGSWYKVSVTEKGNSIDGYIHASIVEVIGGNPEEEEESPRPELQREIPQAERRPVIRRSREEKRFSNGVMLQGGLSLASMSHSAADTQEYDEAEFKKRKTGFLGGLGFDMGQRIGLEVDFFYMQKGITYSGSVTEEGVTYSGEGKVMLDEVCAPVLLKVRFLPGSTPFIVAGGEIAFVLSNKVKWSFTDPGTQELKKGTEDIIDNTNRIDFGLVFGAGYELNLRGGSLVLQGRYHLGLANVLKNEATDQAEESSWVKTNAIVFLVGFKF